MVAVTVEGVCLEVLVDLGEVEINGASPARAGDAGLGINDDVRLDYPRGDGGGESQHSSRRIAARIADERGLRDLVAVEFGQSVNGRLHVLGTGMVNLVPVRIVVEVLKTEVGRDVHGLDSLLYEGLQLLGARGMRERRENEIHAFGDLGRYLHVA